MKRLWSVLLVVCLTVSMMVGCGNKMPANTSQEVCDVGIEALEALDYYLDGKMTLSTLGTKLERFEEEAKELAEKSGESNDDIIVLQIGLAAFNADPSFTEEGDTYKAEEDRDALAKTLGK